MNKFLLTFNFIRSDKKQSKSWCRGFTLLEVLLSIALITILAGVSLPIYYTLFSRNDLDVAKNQVSQSLGRASFISAGSVGDSTWGVKVLSGNIVVFKGTSYALRDASYDEIYSISPSVTPSGLSEIVFSKMTGFPQSIGAIILTSTNGETRTITINSKGSVSY
jgi:prepilin-type N-terminal cleavage/methylation domain-containing protein